MALTIEWTPKAIDGYISILQYIESNFGYVASKKYQNDSAISYKRTLFKDAI